LHGSHTYYICEVNEQVLPLTEKEEIDWAKNTIQKRISRSVTSVDPISIIAPLPLIPKKCISYCHSVDA